MKTTRYINRLLDKTLGIQIKRASKFEAQIASRPVGMVEIFNKDKVMGWVSAKPGDFPIKVTLYVNEFPVANTWADVASNRTTRDEARSFFIPTHDIWGYCKKKHRLTIQVGNQTLPMYDKGVYRTPGTSGSKNLDDLKKLFLEGYVFDNFGNLQLSKKLDSKWQNKIIELYKSVSKVLNEEYGITPFLIYGSLLGQVREGGFIGHDPDFDIAYISKHNDGRQAAMELKDIALTLIDAGFDVLLLAEAIHIHSKKEPQLKIDLFHLFFNDSGRLSFPYGIAGNSQFMLNDWEGTEEAKFAGYSVIIPKNADKLVEYIYGTSWRVPIVGFSWPHARTDWDKSGHIDRKTLDTVNRINLRTNRKQSR